MILTKGERQLKITVTIELGNGATRKCEALIDTGAEVCLIRTGVVPSSTFVLAERPIRLVTANRQTLKGGGPKS
jgi:hypothetical protein